MHVFSGWPVGPGPPWAGKFPAFFIYLGGTMKELSILIDESGDFGSYEPIPEEADPYLLPYEGEWIPPLGISGKSWHPPYGGAISSDLIN